MTEPSNGPRLLMEDVRKRFGGVVALDGVGLEVRAGEVHALVGENGAGKSTLMKVLSGVERPDAGGMRFDGREWRPGGPVEARRAGVAMVHQELALAPHLTVAENVVLGNEPRSGMLGRFGPSQRRAASRLAASALDRLGYGDLAPDRRVSTLSPATRQIVEIARAIAFEARVIVMDEPTSSLGRRDADRLLAVIRRLRDQGISIVYISHHLEEIMAVADRYTVLRDGRTVDTGSMDTIDEAGLVERMIGRSLDAVFPERRSEFGDPVLAVEGLVGRTLPLGAGLEVRTGEILGLAGLVGSGRSEMLRAIAGLDPIRSGSVRIDDRPVSRSAKPRSRMADGIGFLSEDRKGEGLALRMTVGENLLLPRLGPVSRSGVLSGRRMRDATAHWTRRLSIRSGAADRRAGTLSGGNQQKIAIARLLHLDSRILLLDEPTRGIDIGSKVQVYELLDRLAREGRAIVVASGHLPELMGLCDRIAVMHRGRLGPIRLAAESTESELMTEAVRGAERMEESAA
ncbi:MAG: sugar ABC transporter ATP-binding protein [Phycisphaera sp.]|nr:sugar ABC transporter ATP-binding protein [Phycisphaera sp.]